MERGEVNEEDIINYYSISNLTSKKILIRENDLFALDMKELKEDSHQMHEYFKDNPEKIKGMILENLKIFKLNHSYFKIKNFSYMHPISILRVEHINKLVKVMGMITKTTKVIAMVKEKKFECRECGTVITCHNGASPTICSCGQRNKFKILKTISVDIQEVELEELQEDLGDKQPQKIRVRFKEGLCDKDISGSLQPGNKIEVIGSVEAIQIFKTKNKNDTEELFEYRVDAYDLNQLEEKFSDIVITQEDEMQIKEIAAGNPLNKLAESLSPSIYGHQEVKKAVILQMVGGTSEIGVDGQATRGRIHILICGDPSTGKSQIGKNVNKRMPKSYYVSGDEVTKVGLTSIVDRDPLTNQWCLKAGALCKCNDSIIVIDEMDKIKPEDIVALHTPMESGMILVDKADIHTSLRADCSVLAISNPKDGMFVTNDPNTPLTKQLNLPSPLLTRFDLIFVMTDTIDRNKDNEIVKKIFFNNQQSATEYMSQDLFRKYILYAKTFKPQKSEEYLEDLSNFYSDMRARSIDPQSRLKGMPVTTRHMQGLMRLATAHAKLRLSNKIEKQDFEVAKTLFQDSLLKLGMSEKGVIDFARIGPGQPLNNKIRIQIILESLREYQESTGQRMMPLEELKNVVIDKGISKYEFYSLVEELKKGAEVFEPKSSYIQLVP